MKLKFNEIVRCCLYKSVHKIKENVYYFNVKMNFIMFMSL